jgi:hypothetical protein
MPSHFSSLGLTLATPQPTLYLQVKSQGGEIIGGVSEGMMTLSGLKMSLQIASSSGHSM